MSIKRIRITAMAFLAAAFVLANLGSARAESTTILVVGASSIEGTLGKELEDRLEGYKDVRIVRWGQHSTGLANPGLLDWQAKLEELLKAHKPDLVLADLGENDCAPVTDASGPLARFGTPEWEKIYGERVEKFVSTVVASGADSVMMGIPTMRDRQFSQQVEQLNKVLKASTEAGGGFYLDTWAFTADAKGRYVPNLEYEGKDRMIRASDGVHFSKHGSEYMAFKVCAILEDRYGLQSK
ncbi:MAG: DUF459 domain-containing protein [bacterium]